MTVNTNSQVNKYFVFFGLTDTLFTCERFFSYKVKILVELKRKGLVVSCSSVVLPRLKEFVTKGKVLRYLEFDSSVSRNLTAPNFKVSAKNSASSPNSIQRDQNTCIPLLRLSVNQKFQNGVFSLKH